MIFRKIMYSFDEVMHRSALKDSEITGSCTKVIEHFGLSCSRLCMYAVHE